MQRHHITMQQLEPSYISALEISISAVALRLDCVMATMGVSSLMRCCVCVSAKWTFSLGSVKSTGVDSGSPLITPGSSHWPGVERESALRTFPRTHAVKVKSDWSGRGLNRIWCCYHAVARMSDMAEVYLCKCKTICGPTIQEHRSKKGNYKFWHQKNPPLHVLTYEWWVYNTCKHHSLSGSCGSWKQQVVDVL